jgi:hypothetical protein
MMAPRSRASRWSRPRWLRVGHLVPRLVQQFLGRDHRALGLQHADYTVGGMSAQLDLPPGRNRYG